MIWRKFVFDDVARLVAQKIIGGALAQNDNTLLPLRRHKIAKSFSQYDTQASCALTTEKTMNQFILEAVLSRVLQIIAVDCSPSTLSRSF